MQVESGWIEFLPGRLSCRELRSQTYPYVLNWLLKAMTTGFIRNSQISPTDAIPMNNAILVVASSPEHQASPHCAFWLNRAPHASGESESLWGGRLLRPFSLTPISYHLPGMI